MEKIFIKYNPYIVKVEILVNGEKPQAESFLNFEDHRLQEWIDDLPSILVNEYNSKDFQIEFYGTKLDYEDICMMAKSAKNQGINIEVSYIPAKEMTNKEEEIKKIFMEIQEGPFEELKKPDIIKSFQLATSKDFEVNVVATMSAGKSTLINALLRKKLMPTKQEACTATITQIKDNDLKDFEAIAYNKNGEIITEIPNLQYDDMVKLNSDLDVSKIMVEGNIPFVESNNVSLVLIDTPGPNNARDKNHRVATYKMLSESSKTLVLYIMNATQFAIEDDNNLLKKVAESMKVGGKQSRDRFIFVVNKLDDFKKDEDSVQETLQKVRDYLLDRGIENPNIYPASALTALNIRTILKNLESKDDNDDVYEAKGKVRKFNRNEEMYLERYAPLPKACNDKISNKMEEYSNNNDSNGQALIHSGIISIEEAINLYVNKYAKTAKIKNIVDTFMSKIEGAKSFEKLKQQILKNEDEKNDIVSKITEIENKLNDGKEALKFKEKVKNIDYGQLIIHNVYDEIKKAQDRLTEYMEITNKKYSKEEARALCDQLSKFCNNLQTELHIKLENLIENNVYKTANDLLENYKEKLSALIENASLENLEINPFKLMIYDIPNVENIIDESTETEKIRVGGHWISTAKWYNPFSWFSKEYVPEYEYKEYIDGEELSQKFFAPIQESIFKNGQEAVYYANEQTQKIKNSFSIKFEQLDELLNIKLKELKTCIINKDTVNEKLEALNVKLEWLQNIQNRLNSILEI